MKVFVLICGLLFAAAVGYFVIDRLGRFLDRGGISPYWDEEEERLAVCEKKRAPSLGLHTLSRGLQQFQFQGSMMGTTRERSAFYAG